MNNVVMMGRLAGEPQIISGGYDEEGNVKSGIAHFRIAVDRRFKREGQPDADFFNVSAFGKSADFVQNYLHRGTKVVIQGRLQNDNYPDKATGQMVYRDQIVAENIEFAESKRAADAASAAAPAAGAAKAAPADVSEV